MRLRWRLPWFKNRVQIDCLQERVQTIEDVLGETRIANFIKIITYRKGMKLGEPPPDPISLEDLERRIAALESKETS